MPLKTLTALSMAVLIALGLTMSRRPVRPAEAQKPMEKLPEILSVKPLKPAATDGELRKLLIARHNEAVAEVEAASAAFRLRQEPLDGLLGALRRLTESRVALTEDSATQVRYLEQHLAYVKDVERVTESRIKVAIQGQGALPRVRYERIDLEVRLFVLKQQLKK